MGHVFLGRSRQWRRWWSVSHSTLYFNINGMLTRFCLTYNEDHAFIFFHLSLHRKKIKITLFPKIVFELLRSDFLQSSLQCKPCSKLLHTQRTFSYLFRDNLEKEPHLITRKNEKMWLEQKWANTLK